MTETVKIRRALISVSDKTGLEALGRALASRSVEILSTGGTAAAMARAGIPVTDVAAFTGFPEILGGRVKTLHPRVHGGLLGVPGDPRHEAEMQAHGLVPIQLVAVTLYPFEAAAAGGADVPAVIENIDIGGPAMIRSAAKNYAGVAVLTDPEDYGALVAEMDANGGATTPEFRRRLAAQAFARTAAYDAAVSGWFAGLTGEAAPRWRAFGGTLVQKLRYGENPHQKAAFYRSPVPRPGAATAEQIQGKELSYNNIADADAAFECAAEFAPEAAAAVVIVKHANPCGAACASALADAWQRALSCDPVSAFGGIVAANRPLDAGTAREIVKIFTEVVIVPGLSPEARDILAAKPNVRVLVTGGLPDPAQPDILVRSVAGGLLVQSRDTFRVDPAGWRVVTRRVPTAGEARDLAFAFTLAKHVKSNAIVFARNGAAVGIGAGQMSRVDAVRLAVLKAEEAGAAAGEERGARLRGAAAASDAFFPFPDAMLAAAEAGVAAFVQPGGAMRDAEVIRAADERGLAMVFTGVRHFRH